MLHFMTRWLGMLALALGCASALATERAGLNRIVTVSIEAQALSTALIEFSKQAGVQVITPSAKVRDLATQGVQGEMSLATALTRLLRGTNLGFHQAGANTIGLDETAAMSDAGTAMQIASSEPGQRSAAARPADSAAAQAEEPAKSPEESAPKGIQEIIVTAQKREERALDVPLSISAFTNNSMREQGAAQLADFLQTAPGVGIVDGETGVQSIQIRGINSVFGDSPVGYYLDELPFSFIGNAAVPDVRTFDVERVEVLRGPQGTLYGDGSIGGTIRVLTADPNLKNLQGDIDLMAMSTEDGADSYAAKGMLNIPIKEDRAALRLVASHEDFGGWIDDITNGVKDENDRSIDNYRAKLRLAPTEKLDLVFSAWHTETDSLNSTSSLENRTSPNSRLVNEVSYDLYSLTARYDFGWARLVSATSWMDFTLKNLGSFGGFPLITDQSQAVRSEELRLTSANDEGFRWTGGLFYRKVERPLKAQVFTFVLDQFSDSKSYAVFGEGTWPLFDKKLDLTVGLRYFKDDRVRDDPVDAATLALIRTLNPSFSGRVDSSFDTVNPRLNLAWHLRDDWMLYTNVAKGLRTGQVQPVVSLITATLIGRTIPIGIDEETLWSYEVGAKGTFAGGRAALEAAAYYNDWKNLQLNAVLDAVSQLSALINGGTARTVGAELSLTLQPVDDLSLRLTASHIDAEYTESKPGINIRKGDRVTSVPENTASLSATYRWPLTNSLKGFAYGIAQYTSDRVDLLNNAIPSDDYTVVDMRLGVEGKAWGIYLFGDNLTDENGAIDVSFLTALGTAPRLRPRSYGVNTSFSFR